MTYIEFVFAVLDNLQTYAVISLIVLTLGIIPLCFLWFEGGLKQEHAYVMRLYRNVYVASLVVCMLPSPDQLWRIRISLIKLSLANAENVQRGVEAIERIGAKLECKYLGCKKDK